MSLRLFLAVEPPTAVRQEAARAVTHLRRALPGLRARFVDPAQAHLTLVFLGEVEEATVAPLVRTLEGIGRTTRPFRCVTAGLGAFPTPRRPSVLWLGIGAGGEALAEVQGDLARAVTPAEADTRFVPHLTLARVRGLGGADRDAVAAALDAFEPAAAPWPVDELVLVRSELSPQGARHTALARAPLAAPA